MKSVDSSAGNVVLAARAKRIWSPEGSSGEQPILGVISLRLP